MHWISKKNYIIYTRINDLNQSSGNTKSSSQHKKEIFNQKTYYLQYLQIIISNIYSYIDS